MAFQSMYVTRDCSDALPRAQACNNTSEMVHVTVAMYDYIHIYIYICVITYIYIYIYNIAG